MVALSHPWLTAMMVERSSEYMAISHGHAAQIPCSHTDNTVGLKHWSCLVPAKETGRSSVI